jgi:hypothetical protein
MVSRALGIVLGALLAGCSAVLPSDRPIACEMTDGGDPCHPLRMRCVEGVCRSVCLGSEICNGVDDDCDGPVDEEIDDDRDGYFGCQARAPDCDDGNPSVNPGSMEVCNGVDDNCDGGIDTPPDGKPPLCREGQACIPRRGGCVVPTCLDPESPRCSRGYVCDMATGACVPGADCTLAPGLCSEGQTCDRITHRCVTPAALGEPCNTDYECRSLRCFPATEALRLRSGVTAGRTGVCGQACCSNADCPEGFLCWTPGTGARSCVRAEVFGDHAPSGRPCADDLACGGEACVLGVASGYDRESIGGTWCGEPRATTTSAVCDDSDTSSDCRSGVCYYMYRRRDWFLWREVQFGPCAHPCRTSAWCQEVARAYNAAWRANFGTSISLHCGYARLEGSGDWFPLCVRTDEMESPAGASCATHAECLDDGCVRGTCRSVCCADSDCPAGQQCRPFAISGRWQMHCGTIDDVVPAM